MPVEQIDLRELLIERIRELRKEKAKATSRDSIRSLEDLELFNLNLYHKIFGGKV